MADFDLCGVRQSNPCADQNPPDEKPVVICPKCGALSDVGEKPFSGESVFTANLWMAVATCPDCGWHGRVCAQDGTVLEPECHSFIRYQCVTCGQVALD